MGVQTPAATTPDAAMKPRSSAAMRLSVACTVRNEARSIRRLLDSLLSQTVAPTEVIVADGGSQDGTAQIVAEYQQRGQPVRLVAAPEACRGRGRNLAIAASRTEWVALIDGGCEPDPRWLEELLGVLERAPSCDAVFGIVAPITDGLFTECVSTASFQAVALADGRRVMSYSVASVLIRRSAWERLGGFVEGLGTGEDVLFVERIRRGDLAVRLAPSAVVHWQIPRTLGGVMRRLVHYSYHSLEAGLARTWHVRTCLYTAAALLLATLGAARSPWWFLLLGGFWLLRALKTISRNDKTARGLSAFHPARLLVVGVLLTAMDLATLYGAWRWLIGSRRVHPLRTAPRS